MEYQQLPPDSEKSAEDGPSGLMQSKSTLDGDTPIPPATAGVQEQNNSGLEEYERHLIRGQRFKISMVCVMVLVASLSIGCMVLSISQYRKQYANKACGSVLLSLSNATSTLIVEAIASIYYVADPTAEDDVPDRVIAAPMLALQANTREQLFKSLEEADVCSSQSNYGMLGIAELLKLQGMVMMRLINATECSLAYRDAAIRMGSTLSFYTGVGVGEGIASMVWYEQLLLAVRAMGTMAISATAKNHSHQADLYAFNYSSIAMVSLQLVQALSAVMDPYEPTLVGQFLQSIFRPAMVIQGMVLRVGGDFDNLQVVGELEPLPAINALIATFQEIIKELQHAKPWANASFKTWFATICLFAVVIILCFGVALLTTRDILFSIFSARAEVIEIYNTSRLEGSMARMEYFMDRVYHMDPHGVREIAEISANYPMTTAVERNVLKLEAPVLQVLSYVSPCIMGRRLESLRTDTDSLLHESVLQASEKTDVVEEGNALAETMGDVFTGEPPGAELIVSGLYPTQACLVLVDFTSFCTELSAERFKTLPVELKTVYGEVAQLIHHFHGHIVGTSGSVLVAGWNLCGGTFVEQPENCAGFLLLKLRDEVFTSKRTLHCAVVSGTIPQGVVGSETLQTFVMEGSLLRMGRYLLQIARNHDTSFVVDFSTFLRLDTRQFYKRAVQKVALDSRCKGVPGNETVVFELLPTSSEVSQQNVLLWNEAFDNFHTGHIEDAKMKMRRWERLYGSTPSWNSLMMCMEERPPRTITYLYTETEEGFDLSLFC